MPSGNGIHLVRADSEHPGGVAPDNYEDFRDQLIAQLREVTDPVDGASVVSRMWKREEIFAGPSIALAPDLTLELADGGLVSILDSQTVVAPRPQPGGSHRPEGIFIAGGAGVRAGVELPELSILDVAPLLLYSVGVPIPAELQGHVATDLLTPEALRAKPVEISGLPAVAQPAPVMVESVWDEEDEAEIYQRLQALGYVE